jgi:23S rRNA pseudouridine955/2504/2580 synthase
MAFIGHPLIGDGKYGINKADRERGYKYQALYSYKLKFSFKEESGALGYLDGKEFKIDKIEIAKKNFSLIRRKSIEIIRILENIGVDF